MIKKDVKQNKNIIYCDSDKCNKKWKEIIKIKKLGDLYFCEEHKIKFEKETMPILQDYLKEEDEKDKKITERIKELEKKE